MRRHTIGAETGAKKVLVNIEKIEKPLSSKGFVLAEAVGFEPPATIEKTLTHNNK
jgi:hypothetical protein